MAKEVKQAESLAAFFEKVKSYVNENINQIAAIGSIVIILVAGIGYWKYTSVKTEKDSFTNFSKALTVVSKEVKSETERGINNQQALKIFKDMIKKYPDTKTGIASLYYSGNCSFTLKNYDEAVDYYNEFLKTSGGSFVYLKALAYEGLGYVYEAKGEFTKAIEWFEKQRNEGKNVDVSTALLNIARCYELAGDKTSACKYYSDFNSEHPSSAFIETVQMKLNDLCANDAKG